MRRRCLTAFVLAVASTAGGLVAWLARDGLPADPWTVALLVGLAALVGARPVHIAALQARVTATHPFELGAMAGFGPLAGVAVSLASVLGATFGQRKRPRLIHLAFNLGTFVLSISAASLAFGALGGVPGARVVELLWPLAGATAAYFVTNTGLVAAAIALEKRQTYLQTWRQSFGWTTVSFFAGLTLAVGLLLLLETLGAWALALGVPPTWLLLAFHRAYKDRIDEQRRRIIEVESLNAELELKVAERTRELAEALGRIEDANQRLRETNQRLVEANRAKSDFLANVSHELRTPLNGILGFSDLLTDPNFGRLETQQLEFVHDIRDSGEHLLELINDILDLSKIEVGKMQVNRQPCDVSGSVRDVVSMLRSLARKKNIELTHQLDDTLAAARLDRGMFRQILVNLASNAIKFTPEHGKVTVAALRDGEDFRLEVSDTGIGIPQADQDKIFQEFYQVDGSYSRKYQGTGLGLALVRRMMELHDGRVEVDSSPGRGARFVCVFPASVVEAVSTETTAEPEVVRPTGTGKRRHTILLVEDNPLNRKLARNALRSRAYRVVEAETAPQALELVRRHAPDLILMDIQLPGMDGLEATRRLKNDPATAGIRVVALSAFAQKSDQDRALKAGCAGYITKPIRLSTFPAQIESYLLLEEDVA